MSEQPINHYIANCISRIMCAECDPTRHYELSRDLADIFVMAGTLGTAQGHGELLKLLANVERGKYARKKSKR